MPDGNPDPGVGGTMTRYLYGGTLLVFAGVAIALGAVVYQGGVATFEKAQAEVGGMLIMVTEREHETSGLKPLFFSQS